MNIFFQNNLQGKKRFSCLLTSDSTSIIRQRLINKVNILKFTTESLKLVIIVIIVCLTTILLIIIYCSLFCNYFLLFKHKGLIVIVFGLYCAFRYKKLDKYCTTVKITRFTKKE